MRSVLGAVCLILASWAVPSSTGAAPPAAADSLRGTTRPLQRDSSALQTVGRGVLLPFYGAWRVVVWPLELTVQAHDRSERVQRAVEVLAGGKKIGPFRLFPFGSFESGEALAELGLGLKSREWPGRDWYFETKAGFLDRDRNRAELHVSTPDRSSICYHLRGIFASRADRRFHGVGPHADSRKLAYDSRGALVETWVDLRIGRRTLLDAATWYTRHDLDDTADRVDEPEESVAIQLPADFALAEEVEYWGAALRWIFDDRDRGPYSRYGHALVGEVGVNRSLRSGNSDYVHYRVQGQLFVPLSRVHTRTLALRAFAGGAKADEPERMPFTEMERPGGRRGLRGYPRNRFADLRQFVLTAEYRYRLTRRARAAIFADWGGIAPSWDAMRADAIDPSLGFSLIFGTENPTSLQFAFSGEGMQFSFGSDSLFALKSRRLR